MQPRTSCFPRGRLKPTLFVLSNVSSQKGEPFGTIWWDAVSSHHLFSRWLSTLPTRARVPADIDSWEKPHLLGTGPGLVSRAYTYALLFDTFNHRHWRHSCRSVCHSGCHRLSIRRLFAHATIERVN